MGFQGERFQISDFKLPDLRFQINRPQISDHETLDR